MDELARFEAGATDPRGFGHEDHVRAAHAMLARYDFLDAACRYAGGLRMLAERAGAPEKFNITVTVAFLSAIAESKAKNPSASWREFRAQNPALLNKRFLSHWYPDEKLQSQLARRIFLMPKAGR